MTGCPCHDDPSEHIGVWIFLLAIIGVVIFVTVMMLSQSDDPPIPACPRQPMVSVRR